MEKKFMTSSLHHNLEKDEEKILQCFERAWIILVVVDADYNVIQVNQKGCEILGYEKEKIIGKNFLAATFSEDKMSVKGNHIVDNLMAHMNDTNESYERPIVSRNNEDKILEWRFVSRKDQSGKIIGFYCFGEDITQRKCTENLIRIQRDLVFALSTAANFNVRCPY